MGCQVDVRSMSWPLGLEWGGEHYFAGGGLDWPVLAQIQHTKEGAPALGC